MQLKYGVYKFPVHHLSFVLQPSDIWQISIHGVYGRTHPHKLDVEVLCSFVEGSVGRCSNYHFWVPYSPGELHVIPGCLNSCQNRLCAPTGHGPTYRRVPLYPTYPYSPSHIGSTSDKDVKAYMSG